jgi:hypothetical protein
MKKITPETNELSIDTKLPESLTHLISQQDYEHVITLIQDHFKQTGKILLELKEGKITAREKMEGKWVECNYGLGNLVRNVADRKKADWIEVVNHFLGIKIDVSAYLFFSKDYEHAKQYLKVLVKPESFILAGLNSPPAAKTYFPGTISVAVMHYNEQFRFLSIADLEAWGVTIDEVLSEGLNNMLKEKIMIEGKSFYGGEKIFCIISNDYSAASMMHIEKRFPELLGKEGTIFSIPANGTAFASPLNNYETIGQMIVPLVSVTALAYRKEHSPIVFDLFIYSRGEFSSMSDYLKREHPGIYKILRMVS